jgi:hypothetical protein
MSDPHPIHRETPAPDTTDRNPANGDHWEMFAEAMDLTIEGHRLIAQEIAYEAKLLWRGTVSWVRDMTAVTFRRRSSPPF